MNSNQSSNPAKSEAAIRAFLDGTLAGDKAQVRSGLHHASYIDACATYGVVVCNESGGVAEWRLQATLRGGSPYDQFYCRVFKCAVVITGRSESAGTEAVAADPLRGPAIRSMQLLRMGTNQDVAAAVAFLASDEAGFITGISLPVDGGSSCRMPLASLPGERGPVNQ